MTKRKKIISSLAFLGAMTIPVGALISCGGGGISRYDTKNDEKLVVSATFSATGAQTKALKAIVNTYNDWLTANPSKKDEGYMPIDSHIQTVSGGYGKATDALSKKFAAKDKDTVANMIFEYPAAASVMRSYGMQLNLADILNDADQKKLKDRFDPKFWAQNDNIGGLKKGGIYSIPISVSSMANAVNTPFFAYVMDQIIANESSNATTWFGAGQNRTKLKALYDKGKKSGGDITAIGSKWGTLDKTEFNTQKAADDFTIDDSILENWDSLIKFAMAVQSGFKITNPADSRMINVLAFDSPTNIAQMLSYAYADGDMSKFYVTTDEDGYVKYKFLEDESSDSFKNFKKGIELLTKAVAKGALFIGGGGAYGSPLLINHQAMMSLGSTAGASHWYTGQDGTYVVSGYSGAQIKGIQDLAAKEYIHYKGQVIPGKTYTTNELKSGKYSNKLLFTGEKDYSTAQTSKNKHDIIVDLGIASAAALKQKITSSGLINVWKTKDNAIMTELAKHTSDFQKIAKDRDTTGYTYYLTKSDLDKGTSAPQSIKTILTTIPNLFTNFKHVTQRKIDANNKLTKDNGIFFSGDTAADVTATEFKFSSHGNKLLTKTEAKTAHSAGYQITLNDGITKAQVNDWFNPTKEKDASNNPDAFKYLILVSNAKDIKSLVDDYGADKVKEIGYKYNKDADGPKSTDQSRYVILKDFNSKIEESGNTVKIVFKHSAAESLQATEVEGILPPQKVLGKTKGGVYVQGPSIIPVHANSAEDKALSKFVMWLTDDQLKLDFTVGTKKYAGISPLELWLKAASYIAPLKGAFTANSNFNNIIKAGLVSSSKKYFLGTNIAWNIFNKANTNTNISPIIIPTDDLSSKIRTDVTDSAIKEIYTSAHNDGKTPTVDETIDYLKQLAKDNNIH